MLLKKTKYISTREKMKNSFRNGILIGSAVGIILGSIVTCGSYENKFSRLK